MIYHAALHLATLRVKLFRLLYITYWDYVNISNNSQLNLFVISLQKNTVWQHC